MNSGSTQFAGNSFRALLMGFVTLIVGACTSPSAVRLEDGSSFVPDANYHLLMGEIAMQRGALLVAAQEYLKAAQQSDDPEIAGRSTKYAFDYGFDLYTRQSAERWVFVEPGSRDAQGYLARSYFRRGDLAAAFKRYELALGAPEERVDKDYLELGVDLAIDQRPDRTRVLMQKFVDRYPESPGVLLGLSIAALDVGDTTFAIEHARLALDRAPGWFQAEVLLSRALLVAGEKEEAIDRMLKVRDF
jgi:tetratricopeptide (TPR) repeat protein